MIRRRRSGAARRAVAALWLPLIAFVLLGAPPPAMAEPQATKLPKQKRSPKQTEVAGPNESPVLAADRIEQTSPGEYVMTGDVDFRYGVAQVLADTLHYSEPTRTATAEGNAVLKYGASQISGDRIEVNLDTEHAVVDNARAYLDPDLILQAEKVERLGEQTFRVYHGTITTCTQPTPYWSFYVTSAIINVGRYAHMRNATLRVGVVPIFWTPYLVWPIKEDRAPGLLMPHFGFTAKRGFFIGDAVYIPIGRSVDATFQFDVYNGATSGQTQELPQIGEGLEFRYVPSASSNGLLTSYFVRERVRLQPGADVIERDRYQISLAHTQRFSNGFRLLMDVNTVSDLDYYQEFERELRYSTNPTVPSQIDLTRQTGPWALNVRLNRQLQFLDVVQGAGGSLLTEDTTQWRLPEVKFAGRGLRLGRSPFYLTFESSLDGLARGTRLVDSAGRLQDQTFTYTRMDLFPTVTGSFTPVPWLDVSPVVAFRETYYSTTDEDPGSAVQSGGDSLLRSQFHFGVSVVGPRFFRLFGSDAPDATRYKHTFEPRIGYDYIPDIKGADKIIQFDEVDTVLPSSNVFSYSLTSRLLAKKPPSKDPGLQRETPLLSQSFASLVLGEEAPRRTQQMLPTEAPPPAAAQAPSPQGALPSPSGPAGAAETPPVSESVIPAPSGPEGASAAGPSGAPSPTGGETYVPSEVSTTAGMTTPFGPTAPGGPAGKEPLQNVGSVEIATFEIAQRYSLDRIKPLSTSQALDAESPFSPVDFTIRYNPSFATSIDLRTSYDILFHDISSITLSSTARDKDKAYLSLSWFWNRDLEGRPATADPSCADDPTRLVGREGFDPGRCFDNRSQIRLFGGFALLGHKITSDVEAAYDIEKRFWQDQRYRVGYNTQCCGILLEVARRFIFSSTLGQTSVTEYRFVLNLRGVGTFLDLNGRSQ